MKIGTSNKLFLGSKLVLSSGREVELNLEREENNSLVFLSFFNTFDPVTQKVKPVSIRFEFEGKEKEEEAIVSFECRGGIPQTGKQTPASELPIDGINGQDSSFTMPELFELYNSVKVLSQKHLERENNIN